MSKALVARRWFVGTVVFVALGGRASGQTSEQPVQAWGRSYPLTYSPGMLASIKSLADGGKAMEPEGPCLEQEIGGAPGKMLPHDFSHARGRLATLEREAGEPLSYRTWGTIDIKNTSSKTMTSATIELPFAGEFAIALPGQTILGKFERSIPIGSINADTSVNVKFWTAATAGVAFFTNDARVKYQEGSTSISAAPEATEPAHTTPHGNEAWPWVQAVALFAILVGIAVVLMRLRRLEGRS